MVAQTAAPADTETPAATLKINVRTVLVDVVALDKKNQVVPNLHKEDFKVFEDGKEQKITFFEPNFGEEAPADAAPAAPLSPNTFTNIPKVREKDAVNVLLMDALNTQLGDQAYVHKEMVKYLGSIPPGIRIGVFVLGERMRLVQGFTQDSAVLRESIRRLAANPSTSSLLSTPDATAAMNSATAMIQQQANETGSSSLADMASSLQQFLDQEAGFETNERMVTTLDALQQLSRYLAGVPGRKNVIWFLGDMPACLAAMVSETELTNGGCPYDEKFAKTLAMLADARVSLYPIAATGVETPGLYQASAPPVAAGASLGNTGSSAAQGHGGPSTPAVSAFQSLIGTQSSQLQSEMSKRAVSQAQMDDVAKATGGQATYNSNGFKQALASDIENGSRYYTIAYTPTDTREIGKERRIEIRPASADVKLSYRRGYFEQTPKELKAAEAAPATDPLRPLMDRGMPNFTQLRYKMQVTPASMQPAAGMPVAGDNPALTGPATRYTVRFSLSTAGLTLNQGPDGVRRGTVEVALIAYSQAGKSLNWVVRSINLAIRPEQNVIAEKSGIPLHFDIDAPAGDVYLRTGIYDTATSKAGTLEIPLSSIVVAQK
jgi:VWFA-related protein